MAHAVGDDPDEHLAGSGIVDGDRLDPRGRAAPADHDPARISHRSLSSSSSGSAMRPWFAADAHASVRPMDVVGLRDLVASREDEFLAELEAMVNVDCGSYTPDGVNAIVDRCEQRLRDGGWDDRPSRA